MENSTYLRARAIYERVTNEKHGWTDSEWRRHATRAGIVTILLNLALNKDEENIATYIRSRADTDILTELVTYAETNAKFTDFGDSLYWQRLCGQHGLDKTLKIKDTLRLELERDLVKKLAA